VPLSVLEIADQAELIVCCYGEFMETPYQEKHIFQGNSRGKVFVNGRSKGVFETQSTHSYS
jgi:hydrogenase maturation factor